MMEAHRECRSRSSYYSLRCNLSRIRNGDLYGNIANAIRSSVFRQLSVNGPLETHQQNHRDAEHDGALRLRIQMPQQRVIASKDAEIASLSIHVLFIKSTGDREIRVLPKIPQNYESPSSLIGWVADYPFLS